jgi:hypothetical protein
VSAKYSEAVLAEAGLVSYWRLGEAAGTEAADSKGTNKGVYKNAPTLAQAGAIVNDANTAVKLNGTTQYITVAHAASLNFADVFTFECWVKRSALGGANDCLMSKEAGSARVTFTGENKVKLRRAGVADIVESKTKIADTTLWHHVVVTKNGATTKIYVDGVDVTGTVTNSTLVNNEKELWFGAEPGPENFLSASLDEIALYNVALSAAQVLNHYTLGRGTDFAAAGGSSSATLSLRAPNRLQLGSAPGSSSPTLALRTPTGIPMAAAPGSSSPTLSLFAPFRVPMNPSPGTSSATLQLGVKVKLPLGTAPGKASATLSLKARPRLTLSAAGSASPTVTFRARPRVRVRELPPLRKSIIIENPRGKRFRWGEDEPKAANVFEDLTSGSEVNGGWSDFSCTLPRKPGVDYSDLLRLSTIKEYSNGQQVGEYRLESTPRVSGDKIAVTPSAKGWSSALEDDETAQEIIIDCDESGWGEPSTQRKANFLKENYKQAASISSGWTDAGEAPPGILMDFTSVTLEEGKNEMGEQCYYGGGVDIGEVLYFFKVLAGPEGNASWIDLARLSDDDVMSSYNDGSDHNATTQSAAVPKSVQAPGPGRKYAFLISAWAGGGASGQMADVHAWLLPKVLGLHPLTLRGTWPEVGFLEGDIVAYLAAKYAPILNFTTGERGTIRPGSFVIQQFAFKEDTTALAMINEAARFSLPEFAVWNDKTLYYHERGGGLSKRWRSRMRPAKFEETGPSMERSFNGAIGTYRDDSGATRRVGPLLDDDPLNPANELGIKRYARLNLQRARSAPRAEEALRVFLEDAKQLDGSGRATLVGHVEDEYGHMHPYDRVKGGDYLQLTDAADTSFRRIVRAPRTRSSRSASVDLDAPPASLDALLQRIEATFESVALG